MDVGQDVQRERGLVRAGVVDGARRRRQGGERRVVELRSKPGSRESDEASTAASGLSLRTHLCKAEAAAPAHDAAWPQIKATGARRRR